MGFVSRHRSSSINFVSRAFVLNDSVLGHRTNPFFGPRRGQEDNSVPLCCMLHSYRTPLYCCCLGDAQFYIRLASKSLCSCVCICVPVLFVFLPSRTDHDCHTYKYYGSPRPLPRVCPRNAQTPVRRPEIVAQTPTSVSRFALAFQ